MDVKSTLLKAFDCHKTGRVMEAEELYGQAIQELLKIVVDKTTDEYKRKVYYERIDEYISTAEQLKERMKKEFTPGEGIASIAIEDNSTGHSYKTLFGKYLTSDVKEVLLEEPYLHMKSHFQNLVMFLELVVKSCINFKYIRIITKTDSKDALNQSTIFNYMTKNLEERGIRMTIKYEETLHDRKIILSNGYIISIGRGLNIYKSITPLYTLGLVDYDFRKCMQTDVHIFRTKK